MPVPLLVAIKCRSRSCEKMSGRISGLRRGAFYHRSSVQCERWVTVSLSYGDLLVAHNNSTHAPLRGNMFHSERNTIMYIQRLPVHVQQLFRVASTREQ